MKRVLSGALPILMLLPAATRAQDNPKAELSGGYSFFRATESIPTNGRSFISLGGMNLQGWDAAVAGNLTSWFGVEGDFSGHYGSPSLGPLTVPFGNVRIYSFMGGAKFAYRRSSSFTPYTHFLIGVAHASAGAFGFGLSEGSLAAAAGGGLEIRLNDRFALRAAQVDYLMTRFAGYRQDNIRLSAGLVVRS